MCFTYFAFGLRLDLILYKDVQSPIICYVEHWEKSFKTFKRLFLKTWCCVHFRLVNIKTFSDIYRTRRIIFLELLISQNLQNGNFKVPKKWLLRFSINWQLIRLIDPSIKKILTQPSPTLVTCPPPWWLRGWPGRTSQRSSAESQSDTWKNFSSYFNEIESNQH